jgi:hypothetical protein
MVETKEPEVKEKSENTVLVYYGGDPIKAEQLYNVLSLSKEIGVSYPINGLPIKITDVAVEHKKKWFPIFTITFEGEPVGYGKR